jgi:glutamyl-tRNA reductase
MNEKNMSTKFYTVGLSYKKADAKVRGAFSITKENQKLLLEEAKSKGIEGIFVLSTCNRTEITGFAKHPFELISLLVDYSNGTVEDFKNVSNVYKNKDAVRHLFYIGTGLDSQILGDYEIVGQLKDAFKLAKEVGTTNSYTERLINLVIQASKDVKNTTKLSSGTTSVAYAAIQYLLENVKDYDQKKILIYGLGEIGKNTCKNVLEYTTNKSISLINRTKETALKFKKQHPELNVVDFKDLSSEIMDSDILIVSTGADMPTITKSEIKKNKDLLILDLSMPENVHYSVLEFNKVSLVNVDELSKITDKTLETRKGEIPIAEEIIMKYKKEFYEWISVRKFVPAVNALKESLQIIKNEEINFQSKKIKDFNVQQAEVISSRLIQKITTQFVKHLKDEETSVDQSINVISKMFNIKELSFNEND